MSSILSAIHLHIFSLDSHEYCNRFNRECIFKLMLLYIVVPQVNVTSNNVMYAIAARNMTFSIKVIFFNLLKYEMLKVHSDRKYITFYCIITYVNTTGYLIKSLRIKNVNDK